MLRLALSRKEIVFFLALLSCVVIPYFHHQLVVGIWINALLFFSVSYLGLRQALFLGLFPSMMAFSSGLMTVAAWIPFIVLGNALLCLVFFLSNRLGVVSYLLAALAKGLFLSLSSSLIFSSVACGASMGAMQFVTALLGAFLSFMFCKKTM
jgi:hypothetical protein